MQKFSSKTHFSRLGSSVSAFSENDFAHKKERLCEDTENTSEHDHTYTIHRELISSEQSGSVGTESARCSYRNPSREEGIVAGAYTDVHCTRVVVEQCGLTSEQS